MLQNFNDLVYVVGNAKSIEQMSGAPTMVPFSDEAICFLEALSKRLLKVGKAYSDVTTFAFWCRKAALIKEKAKYDKGELRMGRGIAFHSTPSNVPINFAFSFAAGLLAGNPNIVRLPAKDFPQVNLICKTIKEILHEQPDMKPYVVFVKYASSKDISDYFSSICSSRIIWGGDQTIEIMRQSPLPPRAKEITFADRYSILVLCTEAVLDCKDMKQLAQDFYNDTFFSDQNACTSPQIIIWLGKNKKKAQKKFWSAVHDFVASKYELAPVQSVGKLAAFYRVAAQKDVQLLSRQDNFIYRVKVNKLDSNLLEFKYHSGFFFEYDADSLNEIAPICADKCQTMTYFGVRKEDFIGFISNFVLKGIDRIVPMGKSMDFTLVWDGHDLIRELSRIIDVR